MKRIIIEIDSEGNLVLPDRIKEKFGFVPGDKLILEEHEDRIQLSRSTHSLNRVYVEITNRCNLDCSICIRRTWDDQPGSMSLKSFQRIVKDIQCFNPVPEIFFGGFGESLSHPDIIEMIKQSKDIGAQTSLITNGILLSGDMSEKLVASGLDMLWVSIDGAHPESYLDVRLGDHLSQIIENLEKFQSARTKKHGSSSWSGKPTLGIAMVMMKKNAAELSDIVEMGKKLGATDFFVTNALAYSKEIEQEVLYNKSIYHPDGAWNSSEPRLWLPRMDFEDPIPEAVGKLIQQGYQVHVTGQRVNRNPLTCPFVAKGAMVIRWDGKISPCLSLMYKHTAIFEDWHRQVYPYFVGDIHSESLADLWNDRHYKTLREKLQE
ncbi:MAG: radical SAM protein, partial [Anaerolineales bacterium]|nr:radical SAM protein [Anaerolineales bacterium]